MKKKMLMRLATLCLCAGLVGGSALAAGKIYKNITVQYDNIKLVIDGATITPKDANGSTVEPFIYNGTTYLPVRAVGNAIGKQVTWDGRSKTVYLGDTPNSREWLLDLCPPYLTTAYEVPATFSMAGTTYAHGFHMGFDGYAFVNLNGLYNTLEFDLGYVKGDPCDREFLFYLDGELARTISIGYDELPQHITLPLNGALQLKIESKLPDYELGNTSRYGFANCELS